MKIINLKHKKSKQFGFDNLVKYFDEAYEIESNRFIGILTQELYSEPYIDLELDEADILFYIGHSPNELLDFADQNFRRPQITRAFPNDLKKFDYEERGWQKIPNKEEFSKGYKTMTLVVMEREITKEDGAFNIPNIRLVKSQDIDEIMKLFRKEYPLRYRMIHRMYDEGSECSFVYVEENQINGVNFNRIEENKNLYCSQILVRESERGRKIGTGLYQNCFCFSEQLGLERVIAKSRDATVKFHKELGFIDTENREIYVWRNMKRKI